MAEQIQDVKTGEWLPGANSENSQEPATISEFNPLAPWASMLPWLRLEYLMFEIHLEDDQLRVRGEHGRFEAGLQTKNRIDASIPVELCLEAAEQMQLHLNQMFQHQLQQQMKTMTQAFMMPWTAMMFPFAKR